MSVSVLDQCERPSHEMLIVDSDMNLSLLLLLDSRIQPLDTSPCVILLSDKITQLSVRNHFTGMLEDHGTLLHDTNHSFIIHLVQEM